MASDDCETDFHRSGLGVCDCVSSAGVTASIDTLLREVSCWVDDPAPVSCRRCLVRGVGVGGASFSLSEYTDLESVENDLERVVAVDVVMTDAADEETVDRVR